MTYSGLFDEGKKDEQIAKLKKEIKNLKEIEKQHKKINGELHQENEKLKKDNQILKEGNDILGIYNPAADPAPAIKALLERQIRQGKAMVGICKMHRKNKLYKGAAENWLKNTSLLEVIYRKLTRKN
jgi:ABC-type sugar transport system substrate-binding protein